MDVRTRRGRLPLTLVLGLFATACPRPPVDPTEGDGGAIEGRVGPVDFMRFVQDRPAIGGDWYDYDEAGGHVLTPFPHAYVVREGEGQDARYAAFRVISYYDPDSADSGRFTVGYSMFSDGAWSAEGEWLTSKNVKDDGAVCLDLFTRTEPDCAGAGWQVLLRAYPFLAREGPIVVNRPGVFVRSVEGIPGAGAVHVATLDGRTSLSGLPDPRGIADLDDGDAPGWESASWDLSRFAPNLPRRGMALGARFVDDGFTERGDRYLLLNARRSLVRFEVQPVVDGDVEAGLAFTFTKAAVELRDNTVPEEVSAPVSAVVEMPGPGERVLLTFESDTLVPPSSDLEGGAPPHIPPKESRWDLALERRSDGAPRLVLSPGSAVFNATALSPEPPASLEDIAPPLE